LQQRDAAGGRQQRDGQGPADPDDRQPPAAVLQRQHLSAGVRHAGTVRLCEPEDRLLRTIDSRYLRSGPSGPLLFFGGLSAWARRRPHGPRRTCALQPAGKAAYFPSVQTDPPENAEDPLESGLARARRLRNEGEHAAAATLLNELESTHPSSGLLWQERALVYRAQGYTGGAMTAFRRAVDFNDALPDSWLALVELYRATGRPVDAQHAAACVAKMRSLPAQLLAGSSLLNEGRLEAAEQCIRGYLREHGHHIDGMRLLAQANVKREAYDDAELLLEAILEAAPDYHDARLELGNVMLHRRRFLPALMHARHLLQIEPRHPRWRRLYASACDGLGEFDEALAIYRELLSDTPNDAALRLATAHALRNSGDTRAAIEEFQAVAGIPGGTGGAFLALANIKRFRFRDEDIGHMRRAEAEAGALAERYQLCFALGKALED